jgi:hypothetical protein
LVLEVGVGAGVEGEFDGGFHLRFHRRWGCTVGSVGCLELGWAWQRVASLLKGGSGAIGPWLQAFVGESLVG